MTPEMETQEKRRVWMLDNGWWIIQQQIKYGWCPSEFQIDEAIKEIMIGSHSGRLG